MQIEVIGANSEAVNAAKDKLSKDRKIQIARDYVGYHKDSDVNYWQPFNKFGDDKWIAIYHQIISETYGECRQDNDVREIEIRGSESITGNPVIFTFDVID